jgi:exodeoxyribonuclease VII large subunit
LRAPTPSAAAELAVPEKNDLLLRLDGVLERCAELLRRRVDRLEDKYYRILESECLKNPETIITDRVDYVNELFEKVVLAMERTLEAKSSDIKLLAGKLDSLSPLSVLARGYSIATRNGQLVKCVDQISESDIFELKLTDGELVANVVEKRKIL